MTTPNHGTENSTESAQWAIGSGGFSSGDRRNSGDLAGDIGFDVISIIGFLLHIGMNIRTLVMGHLVRFFSSSWEKARYVSSTSRLGRLALCPQAGPLSDWIYQRHGVLTRHIIANSTSLPGSSADLLVGSSRISNVQSPGDCGQRFLLRRLKGDFAATLL